MPEVFTDKDGKVIGYGFENEEARFRHFDYGPGDVEHPPSTQLDFFYRYIKAVEGGLLACFLGTVAGLWILEASRNSGITVISIVLLALLITHLVGYWAISGMWRANDVGSDDRLMVGFWWIIGGGPCILLGLQMIKWASQVDNKGLSIALKGFGILTTIDASVLVSFPLLILLSHAFRLRNKKNPKT